MPGHEENSAGVLVPEGSANATPQMELLRQLWAEALERPSVGLDDDFFALGGDSLAVARIVVTAAAGGVTIDPNLFIQYRTIREMEKDVKLAAGSP